jgi:ferric-dicitrate binding protein FerR (iron transport regulator)
MDMQNNHHIDLLISKCLSECITSTEKSDLETWLNKDADNRIYFNQVRNIWQTSHPAFSPGSIDVDLAKSKVMRKINKRNWAQDPVMIWWQRIAAVLFLPLLLLMGYLMNQKELLTAEVVYQEIFAPYGMYSKVNLPDGSAVWLNSGSKLKYPVVFKSGERHVYLSGEAYFEVHSDKNNPFIVETNQMRVRATGTAFNVEAYATDSIEAVTLVRGKVNVNMGLLKKVNIQPNERLCLHNSSKNYQVTKCDTYKWCAWKDGVLAFRDDRLDYVFKKIGQKYHVDIVVKDPDIASQLYRATFDGESLDEILSLLKQSAPIQYKRQARIKDPDGQYKKEKIEVFK